MRTDGPSTLCACSGARRVARTLTQLYDHRLRPSGLEAPQFALMVTLEKAGPCSQVMLGRKLDLEKTTISRNLKLLGRKGWIELSIAPDNRVRQWKLTGAGHKVLSIAKPEWEKTQDQLLAVMGAAKWESMFRAFRAVLAAAQTLK